MPAADVIQTITLIISLAIVIIIARNRKWLFIEQTLTYPISLWSIHTTIYYAIVLLNKYTPLKSPVSMHNWSVVLRLSLAVSVLVALAYITTLSKQAREWKPKR